MYVQKRREDVFLRRSGAWQRLGRARKTVRVGELLRTKVDNPKEMLCEIEKFIPKTVVKIKNPTFRALIIGRYTINNAITMVMINKDTDAKQTAHSNKILCAVTLL